MTINLEGKGVTDALGLDPTDAPRQDSMQRADGADRAELQRALLVYGVAGALGADHARSTMNETRV
ncbi:hypothetical protein NX786_29400 [Telluria mixta]|uniref:Uncharacterized protein n=1 Tax=Telluria mixta TaxID=34071 RepID=A0ABT2C7Y0_9BURK|nr:hypothetical protein [Telluria mixta]MCS0633462.1 hypothetical protein [Telluria mixta]WEM96269.1 hypothetical protein P0M04_00530 [Telluria mixta]